MKKYLIASTAITTMFLFTQLSAQSVAAADKNHDHSHEHAHSHTHNHAHQHTHQQDEASKKIYQGYFETDQVKARNLSDYEGEWQSIYPYLLDGTLDVVMAAKATKGDKTANEYRAYYDIGYKTDIRRIVISAHTISFTRPEGTINAKYADDGYEILQYPKGNRGVRFIFKKVSGDEAAPQFVQFSDHAIAPQKAAHFHLYFGNDRAKVLKELDNWPTYYPSKLTGKQVVDEILAH